MGIAAEWNGLIGQGLFSFALLTVENFFLYAAIYFALAGIPYLVLWRWKREHWQHKKIQKRARRSPRVRQEIGLSMLTILTFSAMMALLFVLPRYGVTDIYFSIPDHGWIYFVCSIVIMALVHDSYYYWAHRFMHTRWMFRHVHVVHHQFTNPSPFAAYAFHPGEIVIEIGIFAIAVFLFPLNPYAIFIYTVILTWLNVVSHLGFELYSFGLHKWFITSTHHNMHHSRVSGNFMLYFNFWDKLMGTNHRDYETVYQQLATASPDDAGASGAAQGVRSS